MSFYLQIIIAWWQLEFIWSLTCDDGKSICYRLLTMKCMVFLGRISYSLYLIHEVLIFYICWINYGYRQRPDCDAESSDECAEKWNVYNDHGLMPLWCIPILWVVSFIVAILLNRFFEEPMRKWLRPKKK